MSRLPMIMRYAKTLTFNHISRLAAMVIEFATAVETNEKKPPVLGKSNMFCEERVRALSTGVGSLQHSNN